MNKALLRSLMGYLTWSTVEVAEALGESPLRVQQALDGSAPLSRRQMATLLAAGADTLNQAA